MKKNIKKDIFYLLLISLMFIGLVLFLTKTTYLYGSQLDWYSEHVSIPEYFRTLFYNTKDIFPDYAANIGNGQNIYNFSYYGLLSPIILISYFLPKVPMINFIIVSTIITVITSTILLYIFLRKKGLKSEICLTACIIFIMSSSMSLHSHRHIMFINYMPFLIMGMFGVDKKLDQNKGWLLSLAVFLMIMTSYYFSIGGILTLVIYGIYKYLKGVNKVVFKQFIRSGLSFILPIIIGILSASIIIIPTFATLLYNRAESNFTISLKDLFIPSINSEYALYDSYGLGLTAIVFPAIINYFKKQKENIFLAITLSLLILLPFLNYILNGTMYIDAKSLIPFLPLYIYVIAYFINDIVEKKLNYKVLIPTLIIAIIFIIIKNYKTELILIDLAILIIFIIMYNLTKKKSFIYIPIIICSLINAFFVNNEDNLELKYTIKDNETIIKDALTKITDNDNSFYRIANDFNLSTTPNKNYQNINYYNSTIYSSISNQTYNKFYYDVINNNIPSRNRALTETTSNLLSLMLMNNKYVISRNKPLQGYELVDSTEGLNIYKNTNVLPLGFATSNILSYEDFNKLPDQVKNEALLKTIVADNSSNNNFVSSTTKIDLDWKKILTGDNITLNEDNSIEIKTNDNLKISYELPENYQNKILFVRFKMNNIQSCSEGDLLIKFNNVRNKLTCKEWKYYNGNEVFDYVLAEQNLKDLTISFSKGNYNISDFETYILDYASIEQVKDNIDSYEIDTTKTKGDIIEGNINVKEDGYFMLTVPYDEGYKITVDGNKQDYEKVDSSFIGFKIKNGNHKIKVEYKAPFKDVSLLISLIGIISFVIVTILENRRKI